MSPLAVERLTKESSQEAIDQAISDSYETCMHEPAKAGESVADHQKRCGGMIFAMAREHTGKMMKPNKRR